MPGVTCTTGGPWTDRLADHHREELRARDPEDVRPCSAEEVARDLHRQRTRDNRRPRYARAMEQLQVYDRAINRFARHSETARHLMTAPGVGTVVALAYITGVEAPARFSRSSAVGAYFGMTPRRYQSGEVDQAGRVSKCGDGMVRGLLYEAAKVLLSRSAKPSDLQAWGHALARRSGKKKATMSVTRKLAVILHRMWTTGEPFRWTAVPAPTISLIAHQNHSP